MTAQANTKWTVPTPTTGLDVAFGPRNLNQFLPSDGEIPKEFWHGSTPWNKIISEWFFRGLNPDVLTPKVGIDKNAALAHIKTVLGSYEPKHEHKEAGCAYLMSLWFIEAQP